MNCDDSSIVVGRSVQLVPFQKVDITCKYLGWLNDKQLMRYSRQRHFVHTEESCLEFLSSYQQTPSKFWAIKRKSDGAILGTMTANIDAYNKVADVGILVGETRGGRIGTESWGIAFDYLFRTLALRKVTAGTLATNTAMLKIILRWRMTIEGVRHAQETIEGQHIDMLLFASFRAGWEHNWPEPIVPSSPQG
jgi:[ribosomal protein S5]-alanine N-acetyltransferase